MNRFAFLIAAHDGVDQLALLIDALLPADTEDFVVLHLDQRSKLWRDERNRFIDHPSGRVHVIMNPISVFWAHKSIVLVEKMLLEAALEHGFTTAHLLSGKDWPVTTRRKMVAQINQDRERDCYLEALGPVQTDRMQNIWFLNTINDRIGTDVGRYRLNRLMSGAARIVTTLNNIYGIERSHPYGAPWLKGSQWWSLPKDVAQKVVSELSRKEIAKRLWGTSCSDEHIIQTMVTRLYPDRINDNRRFIIWPDDSNHPQTLCDTDIPNIKKSSAWFARKFDMNVDDSFLTGFPPFV